MIFLGLRMDIARRKTVWRQTKMYCSPRRLTWVGKSIKKTGVAKPRKAAGMIGSSAL